MVLENSGLLESKLREAEEQLKHRSQHHSGPGISQTDIQTLLDLVAPQLSKYPHLARWHRRLSSLNGHQNQNPFEASQAISSLLPDSHVSKGAREVVHAPRTAGTAESRSVAYLGPLSSFSHSAALAHFSTSAELLPSKSIPGVFAMVLSSEATFGVVPIENSIGGRIVQTLEGFRHPDIGILGQIYLPITHHLLSKSPFEAVKRIYSHPQALAQCSNFLLRHCRDAETIPAASTARAAEMAAEEVGAAAISSHAAAAQYGLNILFNNIEDEEENVTRFLVISKAPLQSTGPGATTFLLLQTANSAGSLAKVLLVFSQHNISLSRLESFPSKDNEGVFNFWAELKGDPTQGALKDALVNLKSVTTSFRILGSVPN